MDGCMRFWGSVFEGFGASAWCRAAKIHPKVCRNSPKGLTQKMRRQVFLNELSAKMSLTLKREDELLEFGYRVYPARDWGVMRW